MAEISVQTIEIPLLEIAPPLRLVEEKPDRGQAKPSLRALLAVHFSVPCSSHLNRDEKPVRSGVSLPGGMV
jgi:hypothetical protein